MHHQLKFTQWASCELKRDVAMDFNLTASANKMSLLAYDKEISTLELIHEPDSNEIFPYAFAYVNIPRERPCAQLIDKVELHSIYAASSVQETQELALDPMYVSECAIEAPKPKVVHLDWAPNQLENEPPMLAILSTYGACQVLSKQTSARHWQHQLCDLSKFFISDAFPLAKSPADITKFGELKAFIDLYWITAFAWEPEPVTYGRIIYTANAAGYIVALKLNQDDGEIVEYCRLKTTLGRINYIKAFGGQFLLVANVQGVVQLLRLRHGEMPSVEDGEYLWSKADRMACRKAEVMYSNKMDAYFLVFTKGAHVLAFHLSKEGSVICNSTLYVGGIKITGLAALAADEYIVTTITGVVRHIHLTVTGGAAHGHDNNKTELKIEEQIAATEVDAANFQIIGVATTLNRNIWSFLLCRNKEYGHASRFSQMSVFVSICKLNTIDSLTLLANMNIKRMDDYLDYTVALRLDIFNNFDAEKYSDFFELTNAKFPQELNDAFLQKLQVKLMIVKKLMQYQRIKIKTVKKLSTSEHEFLIRATQITHILCRLRQLRQLELLNPFQKLSARCMLMRLPLLLIELLTLTNAIDSAVSGVNNENPLKHTIERFARLAEDELAGIAYPAAAYADNEQCLDCSEEIDFNTMMCASAHKVQRCSVSYLQIPLFNRHFCAHCQCFALEDEAELQQLFAPGDKVKCTFCRFIFVCDEI